MLILAVIGYSFLVMYEFIPLYKQKFWRDFWVNTVLWTFSFAIAILLCLDIELPSPEKPIRDLITSILGK